MTLFSHRLRPRSGQRIQSAAAALLLCLYAAAAWHGAGDNHEAPAAPSACATTIVCASESSPSTHESESSPVREQADPHACALCTLLHAPATPGVPVALPAVMAEALPALPAPAVLASAAPVGSPPARAPPSPSA